MSINRRTLVAAAALLPFAPALADAPPPDETWDEKWARMLKEDWAWLGHYAEENRALIASGVVTNVVFLGDSITEGWKGKRPGFFKAGRVNRGIGGQTTAQMVLRMLQDVVQLRPRFLHLMAGTNDIAGNTGPMTVAQSSDNLRAMIMLAQHNGIDVLLASVPPAAGFPWRPGLETVGPIRQLNAWAKGFARENGLTFVDYTAALGDEKGAMKPGMATDGVHPTESGYDAMAEVLEPLLVARGS
jgi:lysophospholipase L1-like esterase